MKSLLEVCLVVLGMTAGTPLIVAQSPPGIPMTRGVSVDLPATNNASPVPEADKEGALVITVTADGSVWLGVSRIGIDALAENVRKMISNSTDKSLYIKADSKVAYSKVVQVLDSVRITGTDRLTLLTRQHDPRGTSPLQAPKGLELWLTERRP